MTQTSATQRSSEQADAIRPLNVNFPEAELTELRRRINATKWPERETVADASQGVQLATSQALARYWGTDYDWRKCEARLNALRCVRDRFPFRPLCRVYTPAQFGKFCFRKIHIKRTNCICLLAASLCSTSLGHGVLLLSSFGFFRLRTRRLLFLRP